MGTPLLEIWVICLTLKRSLFVRQITQGVNQSYTPVYTASVHPIYTDYTALGSGKSLRKKAKNLKSMGLWNVNISFTFF